MKIFIFTILLFSSIHTFAQYDARSEKLFQSNNWKVGKTVKIYNHNIVRVAGQGGFFSPTITNLKFIDGDYLVNKAKADAVKEMWTEEDRINKISFYNQLSGIISLKLVRSTIDAANPKFFTLIIKDNNDKEFFRERFDAMIPDYGISSGITYWYSYPSMFIPEGVIPPFSVYIIDEISDPAQHHFKILD